MATSLYSERDEPIASVLTRTLLETKQEVPDFLQLYVPEGKALENLKFEVESDFDPNDIAGAGDAGGDASGGGWGASAEGGNESGGAWGGADASANAPASNGWGASDNANPPANNSWGGGENNSSGWGSGNANAQPQAPAPAAAPAQDGGWNTTAPTNNSGWGSGNAAGSASGWGTAAAPTPQTSAW
jgi:ATP-dependent RNA helicase DDX3X